MAIKLLPHQSYAVDYFTKGRERILNGKNAKDDGKFTIKDGQSWLLADGPRVPPKSGPVSGIYVIHFAEDLYFGYGDMRHYVGKTSNLERRLTSHFDGTGSVKTKLAIERNIEMSIGYIWVCEPTAVRERNMTRACRRYCQVCKVKL